MLFQRMWLKGKKGEKGEQEKTGNRIENAPKIPSQSGIKFIHNRFTSFRKVAK